MLAVLRRECGHVLRGEDDHMLRRVCGHVFVRAPTSFLLAPDCLSGVLVGVFWAC